MKKEYLAPAAYVAVLKSSEILTASKEDDDTGNDIFAD